VSFESFRQAGTHAQPMAEINTTPLVDVMLVLLVIFIITAPLFHQAVAVDLPRVDASRLDDKPRVVQYAVDAQGAVHVDGIAVADAALEVRLRALAQGRAIAPELHLRADRKVAYERVAFAMAAAQRAGLTRIAFVTLPPASGNER
jgi:biopolymer transport protein ExbD